MKFGYKHTRKFYEKWLLLRNKTRYDLHAALRRSYGVVFRNDNEMFDWLIYNQITAWQLKCTMEVQ